MSLFAALTVAVSGLDAQSAAIGNISDSLSNAQTVGFKAIGTNFEALVTSSDAAVNNPGGVTATPQYQNDVQGNLIQSQSSTALAISGEGFFAVQPATTNADGSTSFSGQQYYTRQGDFTLNKDGYIVNSSGYFLDGYSIDQTTGAVNTSEAQPIQISALLDNPVETSTATYNANLPSNTTSTSPFPASSIEVYDALGNAHEMSFTWTNTGTNTWDLNVDVANGKSATSDYTATIPFTFNSSNPVGTIGSITSGTGYTQSTPPGSATNTTTAATVSFNLSFPGTTSAQPLTVNFGDYNSTNGVTQYSDTNDSVSVTSFSQNGIPRGSFSSLSIDQSGFVSINYDNGASKTFFQIPIVQFFAQDQLQRVTGGAYQATEQSGTARYSAPGTVGAGTIAGNSLEESNVDIATEFTQMIQAQQVYSANAKTITTVDQMLSDLLNVAS